jgi:hypothetical protein
LGIGGNPLSREKVVPLVERTSKRSDAQEIRGRNKERNTGLKQIVEKTRDRAVLSEFYFNASQRIERLLTGTGETMRVRTYSKGKFYLIECPDGTRVVQLAVQSNRNATECEDLLVVPFEGEEIAITSEPCELLPLLAEAGRCGLSLVGDPVPAVNLAGAVCPRCNEDDVSWLSVDDDGNIAHCDVCGCDFRLDGYSDVPAE